MHSRFLRPASSTNRGEIVSDATSERARQLSVEKRWSQEAPVDGARSRRLSDTNKSGNIHRDEFWAGMQHFLYHPSTFRPQVGKSVETRLEELEQKMDARLGQIQDQMMDMMKLMRKLQKSTT